MFWEKGAGGAKQSDGFTRGASSPNIRGASFSRETSCFPLEDFFPNLQNRWFSYALTLRVFDVGAGDWFAGWGRQG